MTTNWSHIDGQMRQFSAFFRDELHLDPPLSNNVATAIAEEVRTLDVQVVHEICMSDSIPLQNRLDELVAFQAWMDMANLARDYPAVVRSQVITQNYVCFVYLGESIFRALRTRMPNGSVTRKCCKFLTGNPVRAFRNALAHANWKYKDDFSGILYWARKGDQKDEPMIQWEVTQHQLGFWQAVARCTGYVAFTELQEMEDGQHT